MLNTVYRLTAPRTIEPVVVSQDTVGKVIVRPTHLSICNADQRYYQGARSKEVLDKKLPMALIHEGIGRVVSDDTRTFSPGDCVVMLPNAPVEEDDYIAENYLRSSRFCGSGFDGFMQESMILPPERVVLLPQDVNRDVAAFTELVSVATHAITRFDSIAHGRRNRIGVWGDGNMGYIVSLLLHLRYPDAKIVVFGRNANKLHDFTFADETHLVDDVSGVELVDHAFECAGGEGSVAAIEQIIDRINPEGTVSLLGVSENNVPINTRMVLEKGLRLFGSSRSGREDFEKTVEMYCEHPEVLDYLTALVCSVNDASQISDISAAFEADIRKPMGKTVIKWNM
ncbi:alcohol dehydrogenase catalytic domain-containing protein [Adlercreutzia sp. R25]|uniref:alcohol dehydrogenase catalytic domain-containing protein n=1 Tax=Adlercreutzia shanghongiae TaxID=3111773 RepID=UPI002DB8DE4F|nr:alcohol dehydrogenase catalytic domain-containing protein [Adlercreutzia sp. R25]MEC4273416.1 alcohol dehydrogenase catalytic domain-containing protein [Adlercreutzia sp. R25]